MKACTKCGRRHNDVEKALGKRLYCEDIRGFWSFVGDCHFAQTGHFAQGDTDEVGNWYCLKCGKPLDIGPDTVRKWMAEKDAPKSQLRRCRAVSAVDPTAGAKERF